MGPERHAWISAGVSRSVFVGPFGWHGAYSFTLAPFGLVGSVQKSPSFFSSQSVSPSESASELTQPGTVTHELVGFGQSVRVNGLAYTTAPCFVSTDLAKIAPRTSLPLPTVTVALGATTVTPKFVPMATGVAPRTTSKTFAVALWVVICPSRIGEPRT